MDNYIWEHNEEKRNTTYFVLIIYDISDNKLRNKIVKLLKSYGKRVQKSAFEAYLPDNKFIKMKNQISKLVKEDSIEQVKIYRLKGTSDTFSFGAQIDYEQEDVIFI